MAESCLLFPQKDPSYFFDYCECTFAFDLNVTKLHVVSFHRSSTTFFQYFEVRAMLTRSQGIDDSGIQF